MAEPDAERSTAVRAPTQVDEAFRLEGRDGALTIIDLEVVPGAWAQPQRLACRGEIHGGTVAQLQAAVATLEPGDVIVDLGPATSMDSIGLSVLLATVNHVVSGGHRIAVVCPPGPVYDLIRMTDLVGSLHVVADEPEAERMFAP